MPSSVTHSYFAEDVYNELNNKKIINLNYLKVFGQGPDPYFFYDFHLSKKSKDVHKINSSMQHSLVNKHFVYSSPGLFSSFKYKTFHKLIF